MKNFELLFSALQPVATVGSTQHDLIFAAPDAGAAKHDVWWIIGILAIQAFCYAIASSHRAFSNKIPLAVLIALLMLPLGFFDPSRGFVQSFDVTRIAASLFYGPALLAAAIFAFAALVVRAHSRIWRTIMAILAALLVLNAWWLYGIIEAVN